MQGYWGFLPLLIVAATAEWGWGVLQGHPSDDLLDQRVSFTIALRQQNLDLLEERFWKVSDPKSMHYQQYMTAEQIRDLVSPSQTDQDKVLLWLERYTSKDQIVNRGDSIQVSVTVRHAQDMFGVTMAYYTHPQVQTMIVRCAPGSHIAIPQDLRDIIVLVEGLSAPPVPHYSVHRDVQPDLKTGLFDVVIPQTLYSLYNFPSPVPDTSGLSQGVIEFQGQDFSPAFLTLFSEKMQIPIAPLQNSTIIGPNDPYNPGTEADLDIQFIAGINNQSVNYFWLQANNGWLYTWATAFLAAKSVPSVVSISYGLAEYDQCIVDPPECKSLGVSGHGYVQRVNIEFQKIGLLGVTLLAASGDSGANGRQDIECRGKRLEPDFPAASPYLTAVGATMIVSPVAKLNNPPAFCSEGFYNCLSGGEEQAVSFEVAQFTSGGGFSTVAPMPSYQTAAVAGYFKSNVTFPPKTMFNATGRGYPDVASLGKNCLIDAGVLNFVGGTSCSSPSFAAVVSILNSVQISITGKPLGFINPLLYQMAAACPQCFNDITVGDNVCTEAGCFPSCKGFYCTKGWDPVTGFGSPNVQNMIAYIKTQSM